MTMSEVLSFVVSNWVVLGFFASIVSVIAGLIVYDISPLQPLEEIAYKQKEYKRKEQKEEFKKRMVKRHFELGNAFLNVSQLAAAKFEFLKVLTLDPQNIDGQMGLFKAEVFEPIVKHDYDPEITKKRLNLIQQENPDDPHAFLFLGDVYASIDRKKAFEFYEKAIKRDPSVAAAYLGMGVIFDERGEAERALEMYEKAWSLSQWNQHYLNNISYQYLRMKEYDKAIDKYTLLLNLQGNYLLTHYTISNAYRLVGDLRQAHWFQSRLVGLLNDNKVTSTKENVGGWFFHTDSYPVYFWELEGKKYYAYYSLALTCYLKGDKKEAEEHIKKTKDLKLKDENEIKRLLGFDIKVLQEEQESLKMYAKEFKEKYL